jgi:hypothetical protein
LPPAAAALAVNMAESTLLSVWTWVAGSTWTSAHCSSSLFFVIGPILMRDRMFTSLWGGKQTGAERRPPPLSLRRGLGRPLRGSGEARASSPGTRVVRQPP